MAESVSQSYFGQYQELQCIGRGSYGKLQKDNFCFNKACVKLGSAWLVLHKVENVKYVAKKVLLDGLPPKEQNNCKMEAGLLKNLVHPNIVNYKESFLGDDSLVIIMEYCEGKHSSDITTQSVSQSLL